MVDNNNMHDHSIVLSGTSTIPTAAAAYTQIPQQQQQQQLYHSEAPRLVRPLLLALSSLYGLQSTTTTTTTTNGNSQNVSDQQQQQESDHHPLLQGISTASSSLNHHQYHKLVHDFLLWIQSRNIRRQVQSIYQQYCDSQNGIQQHQQQQEVFVDSNSNNNNNNNATNSSSSPSSSRLTNEIVYMGSSWLACLAVLLVSYGQPYDSTSSSNSNSSNNNTVQATTASIAPQSMFVIQTMLHRCRRVKIIEAIDWEIEDWYDTNDKVQLLQQYNSIQQQQQQNTAIHHDPQQQQVNESFSTERLVTRYMQFVQQIMNADMGVLLHDIATRRGLMILDNHNTEEYIKAEFTMITLAIVIYQITYKLLLQQYSTSTEGIHATTNEHATGSTITPLLSMTVSTFATIAFRCWYTQCCTQSQHQQEPTPSLIVAIRDIYNQMKTILMMKTTNEPMNSIIVAALDVALLYTVAVLPDAILASPGGARGRLSIDPRAIQMGSKNLRHVETNEFSNILLHVHNFYPHHIMMRYILFACERWVSYLPLSHSILSIVQSPLQTISTPNVVSLLNAIYESATWTIDQIISSYIGLSSDQQQQQQQQSNTKKAKQSSRSKKRHKEIVDSHSTDQLRTDALSELQLRGDIAYHVTMHCWNHLYRLSNDTMIHLHKHESISSNNVVVEGEGPIGCMTACANACLPHLIRYPNTIHASEVFHNISEQIQHICKSSNKSIRALAYESLYSLHAVLLERLNDSSSSQNLLPLDDSMNNVIIKHFFSCSMNLSSLCGYPSNYFHHLCAESDHDLEIERNDVRDLLRTVSSSSNYDNSAHDDYPSDISIQILSNLIYACKEGILATRDSNGTIPETVVHAFSALAKPINYLAKSFHHATASSEQNAAAKLILITALQVLMEVNRFVVNSFLHSTLPYHLLLPLSRTVNIGNASFAPFLGVLSSLSDTEVVNSIHNVLDSMILGSILSLEQIPELAGPSILDHSMYDIRGTMRGPGGEDHVGCLTLMRCINENQSLASRMTTSSVPYISRLCQLYQRLKHVEIERGPMIVHGIGVTAQTRRILLGTLCSMEVMSEGQLGASNMLMDLFTASIEGIARYLSKTSQLSQPDFFQITESTLDVVAFTPTIVATLFDSAEQRYSDCLDVLTSSFMNGYHVLTDESTIFQWNRQRASLFALIKKSSQSKQDISDRGAAVSIACVTSECEAINQQCSKGPSSSSFIFVEDFISPESIPAGLMIRVIAEVINLSSNIDSVVDTSSTPFPRCLHVLTSVKSTVLSTILSKCPDPQCHMNSFVDPRPTLSEAWLQAMIAISEYNLLGPHSMENVDPSEAEILLIETSVTIVFLLFYSSLGKTTSDRSSDPGMSMDGPHSLAIMSFFTTYFRHGPMMMKWAGERLLDSVPVNPESVSGAVAVNNNFVGISIIGAALFRACQGALPPWAIEYVPEVYCAIFESALRSDVEIFGQWMQISMDIRLPLALEPSIHLAGCHSGQLLSGRYFETMSSPAKMAFVTEAKQLAATGGGASWKRLKGLIKQVCGGKKKDTDFNQKPSPTRWDFDRI